MTAQEINTTEHPPANEQPAKNRGIAGAIILIALGTLFLLHNLDIVPWDIWNTLWKFWPLVLILLGLESLAGGGWAANIIIGIIAIVTIFAAIALSIESQSDLRPGFNISQLPNEFIEIVTKEPQRTTTEKAIYSSDYPLIQELNLSIELGAGNLTLEEIEKPQIIFEVTATHHQGWENPKLETKKEENLLNVALKTEFTKPVFFSSPSKAVNYYATLGKQSLPTNINVQIGAGEANLDLNKTIIKELNLETAAGKATIILGDESVSNKRMDLSVGAGSINIELPKNVGLRINHKVGLGTLLLNQSSIKGGGTFITEGYNNVLKSIVMDIEVGVGRVEINTR